MMLKIQSTKFRLESIAVIRSIINGTITIPASGFLSILLSAVANPGPFPCLPLLRFLLWLLE